MTIPPHLVPVLEQHLSKHMALTKAPGDLAAATGPRWPTSMQRIGHSPPAAALRYQHAAQDRDRSIAEALSGFAEAKVVPLGRAE
jgi:hypothetical protein